MRHVGTNELHGVQALDTSKDCERHRSQWGWLLNPPAKMRDITICDEKNTYEGFRRHYGARHCKSSGVCDKFRGNIFILSRYSCRGMAPARRAEHRATYVQESLPAMVASVAQDEGNAETPRSAVYVDLPPEGQ